MQADTGNYAVFSVVFYHCYNINVIQNLHIRYNLHTLNVNVEYDNVLSFSKWILEVSWIFCHFYRQRGDKCLQIKIAGVVGDDEFAMEMHC